MSKTIDQTIHNKKAMEDKIKDAIQEFIDNNKDYKLKVTAEVLYEKALLTNMDWVDSGVTIKVESQVYID